MRTFGASLYLRGLQGKDNPGAVFRRVLDQWHKERASAPNSAGIGLERSQESETRDAQTLHTFAFMQSADGEGRWTTVVRLLEDASHPEQVAVSVEMNLEDVADRLAPLKVTVRPPRFLRMLRGECVVQTIDGFDAPPGYLDVYDAGQVNLLASEIFSPERKLPLVVVTDPVYEAKLVRDLPTRLATYLFGMCRVVHVSPQMTFSLTDLLGKELSVFDGAVRIYWPGAKATDVGPRHPLFLRRTLASWGPSAEGIEKELFARLAQSLIRAAAPRFRPPPAVDSLQRRIERERLEASSGSVQELKAALTERERLLAEAREFEQLALSDNQQLRAALSGTEEELRAAGEALFAERAKSSALQAALRARGALPEKLGAAEPSTAEEAIERGRADFAEWLVLPDDIALETDLGPSVYQVLKAMTEACKAERSGAKRDRALFQDRLAEHLGHPGRYEPGPTDVFYEIDGERIELRDRIHLRNTRPVDTETVYFAPVGEARQQRKYLIARLGRHA